MTQPNLWNDPQFGAGPEDTEDDSTPVTTKKTIKLQMIDWGDGSRFEKEVPVVVEVGQLVIGKDTQWHIVHPLSGRTVISIPQRVGKKLADVKALAQAMCDTADLDAYWLSGTNDHNIDMRMAEVLNAWSRRQGYRVVKDDYPCLIRSAMTSDLADIQSVTHIHRAVIDEAFDTGLILVADDTLSVVGVCLCARCDGGYEVRALAVKETLRRRKIGHRLLGAVPQLIRATCLVSSPVNTFYRDLGFRYDGQQADQNVWARRV